jgi:glycosyltransferase involved in cell wall biosynthesis
MRILQLTPRLSYPPSDGGRVVMLQIATVMQRLGADVRILSLNPKKQHADLNAARQALAPIPVDAIDIDTSSFAASVLGSFRRLDPPPLVARFVSTRFKRELRALLQTADVDVVQIESPFLLPYVPVIRAVSRAAIVLRSLNVEFRIWEQIAEREERATRRAGLRFIAGSLRRYEIRHLNTCDAIVPITDDDARDFRVLGCTRPMHVLPGGVELDRSEGDQEESGNDDGHSDFERRRGRRRASRRDGGVPATLACHSERAGEWGSEESPTNEAESTGNTAALAGNVVARAGFLGSLDYRPNQDAAIWIAEKLGPKVGGEVHIAGSNAPQWLHERLEASGVTFDGEVPDAKVFIRSMDVMVAPIFSGGGMRIKILEAMALGKPVVSTTIGAAGIGVRHGEDILLADDADAFAAAVTELLRDPAKARAIGDAGRRLVASRYSTDVLARGLLAFYEELTQSRGVDAGR